jgi:hypothetical protein
MKMHNFLFAVTLSLAIPSLAMAARGGHFIPEQFDVHGIVDGLNPADGYIVVDDSVYYVNGATRVHGRKAKAEKVDTLRVGQRVGFYTERSGSQSLPLYELWVLPRTWQDKDPNKDD